jgi:hypothetical protein
MEAVTITKLVKEYGTSFAAWWLFDGTKSNDTIILLCCRVAKINEITVSDFFLNISDLPSRGSEE